MNKSDSERIANYLEKIGYIFSPLEKEADLVVITTCGVKQSAEDRAYGLISKIKKNNSSTKIILTGCLSGREDVQERLKSQVDIWLPITELDGLSEKLGVEKKKDSSLTGYLSIMPKYESSFSAFVPVGNGCDNFCSYCVVPYARGREKYRDAQEVLSEVKNLIKRGYKEITLIAQNVNSYKSKYKNKDIDFADLLKEVNGLEGDFWLRFSTSHPKDMSDKLIDTIAQGEKICEHIHLPAQAGNNEILKVMNRKYTIEHYLGLINKIKQAIPGVSITTDIIVGFPGETKDQFADTKSLFEEVSFDMAYISQYSPRPDTLAAKMDDNITKEEKRQREKDLMNILRKTSLANNQNYLNKKIRVLVEEKNKKGEWFGKTRTSKNVRISSSPKLKIGEFIDVEIYDVKDFGLNGKVI